MLKVFRISANVFGRMFRETGQALDRVGLRIAEKEIFNETFARHRQQMTIFDKVTEQNKDILSSSFNLSLHF